MLELAFCLMKSAMITATKNTVQEEVGNAISRGITYLLEHQYPNGEFCCYMGNSDSLDGWCVPDTTLFPTSLIGNCLIPLKYNPQVQVILDKCVRFINSQRLPGNVWQHYTRFHQYYPHLSPDVDNTACAALFLRSMGDNLIEKRNREIILANTSSRGLLYTWFVFRLRLNNNRTYWRIALNKLKAPLSQFFFWKQMECGPYDVDAVVNANALTYLGNCPELKSVGRYLVELLEDGKEADCDKWYRNPISIYYFISKAYASGIEELTEIRDLLIQRIWATQNGRGQFGESILETALALCSLKNLGYNETVLEPFFRHILNSQGSNGSWARRILFYGGPKKLVGWGSEELTTAFCLEALHGYLPAERPKGGFNNN